MRTQNKYENLHYNLPFLIEELATQLGKIQQETCSLLKQSVILSPEVIAQINEALAKHKDLGITLEDFVFEAISFRLDSLKNNNECLEIPKGQYDELNNAVKEMGTPFLNAEEFLQNQITVVLDKYHDYVRNKAQK